MPKFSLYLIKNGFSVCPRYLLIDDKVIEQPNSVFNIPVLLEHNYLIESRIEQLKHEPIYITKAICPVDAYLKTDDGHPPWWKSFWKIEDDLILQNASAIVFKEIENRLFVFTHGYGRFLLNSFCLEYDFGLKTAVNLIDDDKLKTAGLYTPSEIGLKTIKQTGKNAKVIDYDINIYNSMLKNIAGRVKEEYEEYFKNIDGADCISFSYSGPIEGLFHTASDLFNISKGKSYLETGLYWIDNFKPVRDERKIIEFDSLLLEALNRRSQEILLLFPEVFDSKRDIYFEYAGISDIIARIAKYPYLEIEEQYYTLLHDRVFTSIDEIKRQQINAIDCNGWLNISNYSVYQCLYFEIFQNNTQYYLEGGTWYAVDNLFYQEIEDRYRQLYEKRIDFDFYYERKRIIKEARQEKKNKEYIFNKLLVEHLGQYGKSILLDTNTVSYNRNAIEICDVLYKSDDTYFLIHNKYKYGSSALSHLFSQASVSAECITDKSFRVLANKKIDIPELMFSEEDKIVREPYTIVYGIIGKKNRDGKISMPVFSKINLKLFTDNLHRLGFSSNIAFFEDR
jgi:uncharacterized protein (TIGR04141 family)